MAAISRIKRTLLKQAKPILWVGGVQIQISQVVSYYVMYFNLAMVGLMFWHTTGAPWLRQYYGTAQLWHFIVFIFIMLCNAALFDRKFAYPSRQAYLSHQSYKHSNPSVADLQYIRKKIDKIDGIEAAIKDIQERLDK